MPDNRLPESPIYDYAWETPGTFYHTWGYKSWVKGDPLDIQIKKQIRKLSKIVSMGGNYLLNIGPMSDGTVVPYERDVLNGVGDWVSEHKEAFYNTKANPFKKLNWGYSTVKAKENKIYLHVFDWPENGNLKIPGLKSEIVNAYYLNDILEKPLEISQIENNQNIKVALEPVNKNLSIIVIVYKGDLEIISPVINPVNGELLLTNSDAAKHGKYGMVSYRSIIKDDHRTWDIELEETGEYEIEITYKHKYAEKDFIIEVDNQQLQFTLIGSSKLHPKIPQSIYGNEELKVEKDNKIKGKWNTTVLGAIHLVKGQHVVTLKSGREYVFVPSMDEFRSKDRRYRGLNVEVKSIRLTKRK
jgi:alpha-L-fucosidase